MYYLIRVIYAVIVQGRIFETVYGIFNEIFSTPSLVNYSQDTKAVLKSIESINLEEDVVTRKQLIDEYHPKYAVSELPDDFKYCRREAIIEDRNIIILGEYNKGTKCEAGIVILTPNECIVNDHYNTKNGFLHIHSLFKIGEKSLIVTTGDEKKHVDLWKIEEKSLKFKKTIKKYFGGFTAITKIGSSIYYGSDFSYRPNYIESSGGEKYFFPQKSYRKWVSRFFTIDERYIVSINTEVINTKNKKTISIFDTNNQQYIYCEYLNDYYKLKVSV